jgi:hypothetical protein
MAQHMFVYRADLSAAIGCKTNIVWFLLFKMVIGGAKSAS